MIANGHSMEIGPAVLHRVGRVGKPRHDIKFKQLFMAEKTAKATAKCLKHAIWSPVQVLILITISIYNVSSVFFFKSITSIRKVIFNYILFISIKETLQ